MASLRAPIFEEKVVDFIIEMANVKDREVSVEELLRDPDAEESAPAKAGKTKKPAAKKAAASKASAKADKADNDKAGKEKPKAKTKPKSAKAKD